MPSKESSKSFGIGMLVGAAIGVAVGMLYAPHSGKVTRGLINEKVHEAEREAEKVIKEAKYKAEDIMEEARSKLR
jgi:gas vesicle protein